MRSGPLNGVRIVELAGIGPGPFAAMLLSDLGADVVRVERPGGGTAVVPPHLNLLCRGRPNVAVDLKHPDGAATVLRLVERADGPPQVPVNLLGDFGGGALAACRNDRFR